jgi:hypothetical protein
MVVRQTPNRDAAFGQLPGATNLAAEGTIIGDGRKWDTVQFVPIASDDEIELLVKSIPGTADGDAYVMTVRASMDAITQG